MRNLFVAAVLAVAGSLGVAETASAQYYGYNYSTYNPYTGNVVSKATAITPFGVQAATGYYNPVFGTSGQNYAYSDLYGNSYQSVSGYNPFYGNYGYGVGYNPYLYGGYYGNPNMSGFHYGYNPQSAYTNAVNSYRYNSYINNLYHGRLGRVR